MKSKKLKSGNISQSTQRFLDFSEIKDNTVIMKDGTLRSVILVSSINFSLKSEDEQNATIAAYVSFLNSVDFPLQIVIQSRQLNIDRYIEILENDQTIRLTCENLLTVPISRFFRDRKCWEVLQENRSLPAALRLSRHLRYHEISN